jgi:hypothetical protein
MGDGVMRYAIALTLALMALLFSRGSINVILGLAKHRDRRLFLALPLATLVFGWLCYAVFWLLFDLP